MNILLKVGIKDTPTSFWQELRNVQAHGLSNLGQAIQIAFDHINCDRWENGKVSFMNIYIILLL